MKRKFKEIDRAAVTQQIEKKWNVSLRKIGSWRVYLEDNNERRYIVIGGDGYQGIDKAIFEQEECRIKNDDTLLIFAERRKDELRVFAGEFHLMTREKSRLSNGSDGKQYQFDIYVIGKRAVIHQVPSITLNLLFDVPHTNKDQEKVKAVQALRQLAPQLTPQQRLKLIESLQT